MPPRKTTPQISPQKKLLINADNLEECRAAIVDDGKLKEVIVEHSGRELLKGNVYLGIITRVEPAIEAAFIDFGGKKYGFLPFKDVLKESYLPSKERKARVRIQDVLVRGQKILVQVVKESRDAKGPSMDNGVSIPGRFLVLMYGSPSTGVSRKIEDETERRKLREILADLDLPENMGVIIRTAGVGRTKLELQKDLQMLLKIWESIQEKLKAKDLKPPCMLYEGPDMVVRTVRDHFTADTSEIIVDNVKSYKALKEFLRLVMPRMGKRLRLYQETLPLFSAYNVEEQIENIYQRKVLLPSGGSIVIDVGEAMVCVDVNSGKTTGASALEETATKTNLEAADEIARQLRLRDLGGLIVIDFIDMFQKKNRSLVEKQMKAACKEDKARVNLSRISRFGLLEMSRQRMSPPLKEGTFETCTRCSGTGAIPRESSLALKVLRGIQETIAAGDVKILRVEIPQNVATYLLNHKMKYLVEFQEKHGFTLQVETKRDLEPEAFAYIVLDRKKKVEDKPRESGRPQEAVREPGRMKKPGRGREATRQREPGRDWAKDQPKEEPATEKPGRSRGRRTVAKDKNPQSTRESTSAKRPELARGRRWRSQRTKDPAVTETPTSLDANEPVPPAPVSEPANPATDTKTITPAESGPPNPETRTEAIAPPEKLEMAPPGEDGTPDKKVETAGVPSKDKPADSPPAAAKETKPKRPRSSRRPKATRPRKTPVRRKKAPPKAPEPSGNASPPLVEKLAPKENVAPEEKLATET